MNARGAGLDDRRTRPRRRALGFLAELSQALALALDLDKTLRDGTEQIAEFMQAEAASCSCWTATERFWNAGVCVGPVDIVGLKLAAGQGVVGRRVSPKT